MAEEKMARENVDRERLSLLELIDQLIYHINEERFWFNFICLSSIVASPVSIAVALYIILHPNILRWVYRLGSFLGSLFVVYLGVNLLASTLWLVLALRELQFLRAWNRRFWRYKALTEQVEREMRRMFGEE